MAFPIRIRFEKDNEEKPFVFRLGTKHEDHYEEVRHEEKEKKEFVLEWDKALGFSKDPFAGTMAGSEFFTGYHAERKKLNLFIITDGKFGIIEGEEGTGKTVLMRWLYEQLAAFKSKVVAVYVDGKAPNQQPVLSDIVVELMGQVEKTMKHGKLQMTLDGFALWIKKKVGEKKLVILIDGLKRVTPRDLQLFDKLYRMMNVVIIAADTKAGIEKSLLQRIDKIEEISAGNFKDTLNMKLSGLDYKGAEEMIIKRMESAGSHGLGPFNESILRGLHKKAEGNMRRMLELCRKKAIELSVKQEEASHDMTKDSARSRRKDEAEENKEDESGREENAEETKVTPTQRGADYKIEVISREHGYIMVGDRESKSKGYTIKNE